MTSRPRRDEVALRGYFISLEGIEGCGKTTQAGLLEQRLRDDSLPVIGVREPGGTQLGEAIRAIVLDVDHDTMSPWAEASLYTAARAQLVKEVILPELARGHVVIADRFADSTLAYQGAGRGLDMSILSAMQAVLKLKPDLTFLLDIEPEAGAARQAAVEHRPDRMEQEDLVFFQRVRQGYLDIAGRQADRYVVVDAAQSVEAVGDELLRVTRERTAAHGVRAGG
jgi:dTMP kinase